MNSTTRLPTRSIARSIRRPITATAYCKIALRDVESALIENRLDALRETIASVPSGAQRLALQRGLTDLEARFKAWTSGGLLMPISAAVAPARKERIA